VKYNHWTKIDDGAEGAWAADVWFNVLKVIGDHQGESVYDENSPIYEDLEEKIPELKWRAYENGKFRPYFRDFSKPWVVTNVATFEGTFNVTTAGMELLQNKVSQKPFLVNFLNRYEENNEKPFSILSSAFLLMDYPVKLEEIYQSIILSYRPDNEDKVDLSLFDETVTVPSTARRRTVLMLQLLERSGAILKLGKGVNQKWIAWDRNTLKLISGSTKTNKKIQQLSSVTPISKPFILLAGISGTGKTRFVRKQATEHDVGEINFCLVPVRPDWHEPSDLLGYVSRIGEKPEYVSTKVLQFIIDAWKAVAPNADKNGMGELDYSSPPYWLCLDEMNLAPVEQYFADYLSVLESREFNDGEYRCDPLLDKSVLSTKGANVQEDLKLGHDLNLWEFFLANGVSIPPNLIVAGTVNMDETTHGFSRKVIDRALTIDFGEFYPNDYSKFFKRQHKPKILTYSLNTQITPNTINCPIDTDGETTIKFLEAVNELLKNTPFELAYRALNELLLHVSCFAPETNEHLQAVWDDFLMTKVLPRIDGDEDKLRITDSNGVHNLLDKLEELLSVQLKDIWAIDKNRIDLLRVQHDDNPITDVACRSRIKIRWMKDRLDANTFTSFWP
tara:strand:- start:3757 stop:5607 length:1851 start_codon:yes stop_codon:yes gene_type:complete